MHSRPRTWRWSLTTLFSSPPMYWAGICTRGRRRSTAWRREVLYMVGSPVVRSGHWIMATGGAAWQGGSGGAPRKAHEPVGAERGYLHRGDLPCERNNTL